MIRNILRSTFSSIFCILVALGITAGPLLAQTYTFGVVPQFEARKLARIWEPIIDEIEKRTGYDFKIVGSPRIPEFETSFMNGEFDFAYMNPYHSIIAAQTQGYQPLLRDGGRELFGILVVRDDSDFQSVEDLEGHTIAFPAPNALGASLLIRSDLANQRNVDFSPMYVSTHGSAYLNVILNQAAAAGGVMGTFRSQPIEISEQLRVLYKTTRVPPHPIAAHPRVPEDVQKKVTQAFLDLWKTGYGRELLERVPIREVMEASLDDYSELQEMGLDEFFVK
ncbi:phosphonate transport system substrate-binding protein [Aliiroseovarius halocynthiae]|uniref:Phosphate/phosphite/phosphonate ABC transporter substrate-binding protein n=1 Tax=Aliiroseovarius halocynthiae TaxID=985055 RepID=A0A545SU06_9RHOB|nr:phosphate/phosphite/phosphonate ABC transporter substrate-binding protein [Aliiroseovarius halocynthiae]TQV68445.1 phosphate/phosphite/phosphonate ABC transporter substrate-binding protein [Aliiroseovarius halocynthiae]SMR70841.1 phosphonate transport system substrate-binding protein [Aliiroseovarius halocynthiae]